MNILNTMLYTQDMRILCDDLDAAFGFGLNYESSKYAHGYSQAMEALLSSSEE